MRSKHPQLRDQLTRLSLAFTILSLILLICANAQCYGQCESSSSRVSSIQEQVKADEANIESLGFAETAKDLDEWEQLARDKQKELLRATLSALFDDVLAGAGMPIDIGGVQLKNGLASIGSVKANEIIGNLHAAGVDDPYLADLIRAYARIGSKPGKAAKLREIVGRVKSYRDVARLPDANDISTLGTLIGAVAELRGLPGLGLAVSNSQAFVMLAYSFPEQRLFGSRIEQFTSLTEKQLGALKSAMHSLDLHIQYLRAAKKSYSNCLNQAKSESESSARDKQNKALLDALNNATAAEDACNKQELVPCQHSCSNLSLDEENACLGKCGHVCDSQKAAWEKAFSAWTNHR